MIPHAHEGVRERKAHARPGSFAAPARGVWCIQSRLSRTCRCQAGRGTGGRRTAVGRGPAKGTQPRSRALPIAEGTPDNGPRGKGQAELRTGPQDGGPGPAGMRPCSRTQFQKAHRQGAFADATLQQESGQAPVAHCAAARSESCQAAPEAEPATASQNYTPRADPQAALGLVSD